MPILNDILDHKVIGPAIKQGLKEGRLSIIRRQITHRFGQVPEWVDTRLGALSGEQLEELSDKLFDVQRFEDLFEQQ